MVELRKRKAAPEPEVTNRKKTSIAKVPTNKTTDESESVGATTTTSKSSNTKSASQPFEQGDSINLDGLGGDILLTDGATTNLKSLVDNSVGGVVLFTYPKANTPGCTKQACLFRDAHQALSAYGFSIYGLSNDSPKANLSFKTKHNLQYTLICDQRGTLIAALGFRKPPSGTRRGVIVIDKTGRVLASMMGGPDATVEAVLPLIEQQKAGGEGGGEGAAAELDAAKAQGADKQTMAEAIADAGAGVSAEAEKMDNAEA